MVCKSIKDFSSELLGSSFHGPIGGNAVSPIGAGGKHDQNRHNLPKISFKSMSKGSLDAAAEGELGEGSRCESALTGVSVPATRNLISTVQVRLMHLGRPQRWGE
jgi:hypothetical protein